MPVFNAAHFLEECLESIINQSYADWELIAVNDFSNDESEAILKEYQNKDSRVKYFNNQSKGIIPALRLAFEHTTGDFITRMDADDIMHVQKLELMHQKLVNHGEGHICVGLVKYIGKNLGQGYLNYANWLNELSRSQDNFSDIYKECVIPSPCWMVQRSDLIKSGAFNHDVYPEDYDLCFRFKKLGLKVVSVTEVIHYWRDHPDRSSRNDSNYSDNRFLELKVHHFLDQDYNPDKKLIIWGAGSKGKSVAKKLIEMNIPFDWMTNNSNKIGKEIYGQQLIDSEFISADNRTQIIILVAQIDESDKIKKKVEEMKKENIRLESYSFC